MPVAYVTEPGSVVQIKSRSLTVSKEGEKLADWELVHMDALCLLGGAHITQPAMRALLKEGVEMMLLSSDYQMLGRLAPLNKRNAQLRLEQFRCYEDMQRRKQLGSELVKAKVINARSLLQRYVRNHPETDFKRPIGDMQDIVESLDGTRPIDSLLGVEGNAAQVYFSAFGKMCRGEVTFNGRSRRPPKDEVNALLSLGYTFVVNDLTCLLAAKGFDPCIGFYHEIESGRPALALDLAEPLRTGMVDHFVLYLVNNRIFGKADFECRNGGVYLTRSALKGFVREYQRIMMRKRLDPVSQKRETYRRHIELYVDRFARTLTDQSSPAWFAAQS